MDLPILGVSYKWNHAICGLLWLAFFITRNVSKVRPCCPRLSVLHCFLWPKPTLYGHIMFSLNYRPVDGHSSFFHFFCYCEYYCYEQSFTSYCGNICFLFLLSIHVDIELLGLMVNSMLNFLRGCGAVSQRVAAPFYISNCSTLQFQFLHILANICHYLFF